MEVGLPTRKGLQIWGDEILKLREKIGYEVSLSAQTFGYQTAESAIEVGNFLAEPQYGLAYMEEMISYTRFNSVNLNRQIVKGSRTPNQELVYMKCEIRLKKSGISRVCLGLSLRAVDSR